jgi:WD40 repeat protein
LNGEPADTSTWKGAVLYYLSKKENNVMASLYRELRNRAGVLAGSALFRSFAKVATAFVITVVPATNSLLGQTRTAMPSNVPTFPGPASTLRDKDFKPPKGGVVLGGDGKGGTTVAVYGGPEQIQVSSLSFSDDGRILAVGSTPGRVDLWDVENQKKLRSVEGGSTVALSRDGSLLAKDSRDGNGIELYAVASGKLQRKIQRPLKRAENTIDELSFSPDGAFLDVTANGDDDRVYEVSSGKLIATITNARHSEFSRDGASLIGADNKHLVVWSTRSWTQVRDLPNGPDYTTTVTAWPERDLVVVGGPKVALLRHLSSGEEVAKVGEGFTNFAAFDAADSMILTYSAKSGFVVWKISGEPYCAREDVGNAVAVSANGRWLAGAAEKSGSAAVTIWNLQDALAACRANVGK